MPKRRGQVEGGVPHGRSGHRGGEHEAVGERGSEREGPGSSRRQMTPSPARRISRLAPPIVGSIGGTSSAWFARQIASIGQSEAK